MYVTGYISYNLDKYIIQLDQCTLKKRHITHTYNQCITVKLTDILCC